MTSPSTVSKTKNKTLKKNTIHLQMEQCIRSSSNSVVLGTTRGAGLLFFLFIIDLDWLNRKNPTYQVTSGNRTSTIWLFNIAMEKSTILKFCKPSISIRAIYTMAMLVITRLGMSSNPPNSWYFVHGSHQASGIRLSREAPQRESALVQQRVVSSILGRPGCVR